MKAKRQYVKVKDRRVGLKPSQRTIDKYEKNANQWTLTPKQLNFAEYYFSPKSETFADAYKSAIKAEFSQSYAKRITSNSEGLEWVREARKRMVSFNPNHTVKAIENMAINAKQDRDKLRALELMGKIQGLFIDRSLTEMNVSFTNAVPRPTHVDSDAVIEGDTTTDTQQG